MKIDISGTGIDVKKENHIFDGANKCRKRLLEGEFNLTGWVTLPSEIDKPLIDEIKRVAEQIRKKCNLFIVIGIGGSYLGAKAVIEALNDSKEDHPEIVFAGFNMSAAYLHKVEKRMRHESVCLCVISKSGSTTEPLLTYHILKEKITDKYGEEEGNRRIYIITDKEKGFLRKEAQDNHNISFEVPHNIGGRYSVLSPVGLLPIAVAGHDIESLLQGGADISKSEEWKDSLLDYAICRIALQNRGKLVEIFEYFEMNLDYFGEWLKQLFCESEGKEGRGAFVTSLCFSRDLHSVGQFLQQGTQLFYETLIRIKTAEYDFKIPKTAEELYAGKSLEDVNDCAEQGVILAHKNNGVPIMTIEIPVLDEYNLGQLIYFFEMSCAISAELIGVNPFDQPGVDAYKSEMRRLVKKLK